MWTITGASTEYTVAAVGGRIDLVAWGPHGVSDGPSPYAFRGKVQYMLPGDVAATEYAPDGLRPFLGADLEVAGEVFTWRLDEVVERDGLQAALVDDVTGLRVVLRWRFAPGTDVVERWAEVTNSGAAPVVLNRLGSAGFCVPTPAGATLNFLCGQWAQEFTPASVELARGRFTIGSAQGVTGHQFAPVLTVGNGDALYGVQLAWTGSWEITADTDAAGLTRVRAGRSLVGAPITLAPGDSVTTPIAAGVFTQDGADGLARQWHAYQRNLAGDRLGRTRKVIYNSWEATTFDVTAAGQLALADVAAELGVETFVVDDGWFIGRNDDRAGLGDWTPDPVKFPDGFGAFADAIRARGLDLGLWVEPEMVNPKSALYAAHPEWVYQAEGRPRTTIRNQYLLDLGRQDVYEFIIRTFDELLTAYPISYLKWDFNRPRTEADRGAPDLDGAHVHNLYRLLDHLRTTHPQVTVEGCAAGGARVDLAMAARTDVLWPSDNTAPLDRLRIQDGFLSGYAPHLMSSWVTDANGMFDERTRSLAFRFVLACAGVLGIGADITQWTPAERAEAAGWVARYKEVRDVITQGEVHRIGGPGQARCAAQYTLGDRVVVLAWNADGLDGLDRVPAREIRLPLSGLTPTARYRVRVAHAAELPNTSQRPNAAPLPEFAQRTNVTQPPNAAQRPETEPQATEKQETRRPDAMSQATKEQEIRQPDAVPQGAEEQDARSAPATPHAAKEQEARWTTATPQAADEQEARWTTATPHAAEEQEARWTTATPHAADEQEAGVSVHSGSHLMAVGLPVRWTNTHDADLICLERL